MKSLTALLVLVAFAPIAAATTDGEPTHIKSIGSWRHHDPVEPQYPIYQKWTPSDVVGFLQRFPAAVMDSGYRDGHPPGDSEWRAVGALISEARTIARAQGVPFEGRMCVTERPDIMLRLASTGSCQPGVGGGGCDWEGNMDGTFGEAETVVKESGRATAATETGLSDARASWRPDLYIHRLIVLRPGPGEERRRVVANTATALSVDNPWQQPPRPGDRYEIRGSFDPAWIQRVPRSVYEAALQKLWQDNRNVCGPRGAGLACDPAAEPLDPLNPANHRAWYGYTDRAALEALATSTDVPVLYGPIIDGVTKTDTPSAWRDPFFSPQAVVVDLANPAYRDWRSRYLMYKLRDYTLQAGTPACVMITYKPGWYTYRDESELGASPDVCATPGSNVWTGPAHVCPDGSAWGGPFVAGFYGPGEFEGGLNAYIRETLAKVAQRGWTDLRFITTERPAFANQTWTLLDDDVRHLVKLIGEWDGPIDPPLSLLSTPVPDQDAASDPPATTGTSDGPSAPSSAPASAPESAPATADTTGTGSTGTTSSTATTTTTTTIPAAAGDSSSGGSGATTTSSGGATTTSSGSTSSSGGTMVKSSGGGGSGTITPPSGR